MGYFFTSLNFSRGCGLRVSHAYIETPYTDGDIGIAYAGSGARRSSPCRSEKGKEQLKDIGGAPLVSGPEIARTAACTPGGSLPWISREVLLISTNEAERKAGDFDRFWDFSSTFVRIRFFFLSLGPPVGGVNTRVSSSIVTRISAMLFSHRIGTRLASGWAIGAACPGQG